MGIEVQKSALPILFNFARVRAASQPHVASLSSFHLLFLSVYSFHFADFMIISLFISFFLFYFLFYFSSIFFILGVQLVKFVYLLIGQNVYMTLTVLGSINVLMGELVLARPHLQPALPHVYVPHFSMGQDVKLSRMLNML